MIRAIYTILILAAGLGISRSSDADDTECVQLLRRAIDYRTTKMSSGRVVILEQSMHDVQNAEFLFTVTFDGNQRKVARKSRLMGSTKWGGPNHFVLNDEHYIHDTGAHLGIRPSVELVDSSHEPGSRRFAFDPRSLGMCFGGASSMGRNGLDSFLQFFDEDKAECQVSVSVVDGIDAILLTSVLKSESANQHGRVFRVWLAPEFGHSIVAAEFASDGNGHYLKAKYRDYGSGIWYPSKVVSEDRISGAVRHQHVLTVEEAEFNKEVSSDAFQLRSLNPEARRRTSIDAGDSDFAYEADGAKMLDSEDLAIPPQLEDLDDKKFKGFLTRLLARVSALEKEVADLRSRVSERDTNLEPTP
ncbi:hypothetical protein Pla100_29270 [Neorhodopirellula pilleata]|uniref:Secreted protein n=2 Tax=Neorhodopirellula pilleata TaxID=2714738 RepID=A0A5C6AAQ7_9BACT|nr:hypothetical protein Pla100_29270 [Neorhodopirellula pilleata]